MNAECCFPVRWSPLPHGFLVVAILAGLPPTGLYAQKAPAATDETKSESEKTGDESLAQQLKAITDQRAVYLDAARTVDDRRQALRAANEILRQIILENPSDERVLQWQLELGRSLLYQEAEPFCLNVLYARDSTTDRQKVKLLAGQAAELLELVVRRTTEELDKIDQLPLRELERLDRQGVIERNENLQSQAQYDLRWANYYRCLVMSTSDPQRVELASRTLRELADDSELLTTPHSVSRYQCQSLLLAGLLARLQGNATQALIYLQQAAEVLDSIGDPLERDRLSWARTLTRMEQIRALSDSGSFHQASELADQFGRELGKPGDAGAGLLLALAFEKNRVRLAEADQLLRRGEKGESDRVRALAWKPLADEISASEARRDQVYAVLFARLQDAPVTTPLHLVERCALAAGWLAVADRMSAEEGDAASERTDAMARAEGFARAGWNDPSPGYAEAHAEIGYNLAVILARLDHKADAVRQFLGVTAQHGESKLCTAAALAAVNLAIELRRTKPDDPEASELYLAALRAVTGPNIEGETAGYWRFFLGQALLDIGHFDEAVAELGKISAGHEHYLRARFLRLRGMVAGMERQQVGPANTTEVRDRAIEASKAADEVMRLAAKATQDAEVPTMQAQALLLKATSALAPGVEHPEEALELMAEFDRRFADQPALKAEKDLVLLTADTLLGRADAVRPIVESYLDGQNRDRAARVQNLYERVLEKVNTARSTGQLPPWGAQAEVAWLLASQLYTWAQQPAALLDAGVKRHVELQYAEAALGSGRLELARAEFERHRTADEAEHGAPMRDLRIISGLGETLFAQGDYESALPWFDRVFREWKDKDVTWWKSLLRNLQCRTELNHDPAGIIRSIEQQRFLDPELGGPELRKRFVELEKLNRARAGGAETSDGGS